MMKNTLYTVHIPREGNQDTQINKAAFIPEGFAFYALAFGGFWFMYHRLWLPMILVFAGEIMIVGGLTLAGITPVALSVVKFLYSLLLGFEARNIWRWWLGIRGYNHVASVIAHDPLEAEMRYFTPQTQNAAASYAGGAPVSAPQEPMRATFVPQISPLTGMTPHAPYRGQ